MILREEEIKTSIKEESKGFTHPANRTPSTSSSGKHLSTTTDDDDEEEEEGVQDNTEEEAQKLREASKRVLHFQKSRGSSSSADHSLENQKAPGPSTTLLRQRTFDEETDRYPGDPTNDELIRFLISPPATPKRNLSRRHTMPNKVHKTEEEKDNLFDLSPIRTPNTARAEFTEQSSPKQVFDFHEASPSFEKSDAQDNSLSAEKKNQPSVSTDHTTHEGQGEPNHESTEPTGNHVQKNSENIAPKSSWTKTDTTGLFFSFFKRLGDMSKHQSSKETVQKGSGV